MAARNRGGIHAVIPWIALVVVTIFAFNQLGQRNRARGRAVKAEDALRAAEALAVAAPAAAGTAAPITERERKLDEALQAALEVTKGDTERIDSLEAERDIERARADRLAAVVVTETARADALRRPAAEAAELREALRRDREAMLAELEGVQKEVLRIQVGAGRIADEKSREVEQLEQQLADEQAAHMQHVTRLQQARADANERTNALAVGKTVAENELAQVAEAADSLRKKLAAEEDQHTEDVMQLQSSLNDTNERANQLAILKVTADNELAKLRTRLVEVATAQLAAEDPSHLITGARMVGLLGMRGFTGRLLDLTDHDDGAVVAAAARGLAGASDLAHAALKAGDAALDLMADDSIALRLAGKDLLEAVAGNKVAFDAGAAPAARAAALKKLRKQLGR